MADCKRLPAIRLQRLVVIAVVLLVTCLSGQANAHQFAPALLELAEGAPGQVAVVWKEPVVRVQGSRLRPVLPVHCSGIGRPLIERQGTGMRSTWQLDCPGGLAGSSVGVEGIASSRADVLLRVQLPNGDSVRHVLTAESPVFEIGPDQGKWGVLRGYAAIGIEHILTGWDHLLFVLGIVLLISAGRSLIWTITAFTLGHSLTLALAALGLVNLPAGPVEALIALSIYWLAVEVVRDRLGYTVLLKRSPWLLATGFGLLHGLGFAGALNEVGLPPDEIPLALFAFNLGIELGQLAFVAAIVMAIAALRKLPAAWPEWAIQLPAWTMGALGMFWFMERLEGMTPFTL